MTNFIAEVSSNHHRDIQRCYDFIDAAAASGCQSVKFQLFKIEQLFSAEILSESSSHQARKQWELPLEFIPKLAKRCIERNVKFSCTPFYLDAVAELAPYVDFLKIASYELLWDDLLSTCAETGLPVILSTGMATLPEITHAVEILKGNGCNDPILLHCTSAYPTPYHEANLSAIETIQKATGCRVGWSDHTVDPAVIHRAVHRWGAPAIEFHLDLDGEGDEYKTGHCWLPDQIADVIQTVERSLTADGDGLKEPVPSEMADRAWRADPVDGLRPLMKTRKTWRT